MTSSPRPAERETEHNGTAAPLRRVVLVDRDALARRAMREGLEATGVLRVVAEADGAEDALAAVQLERPDVVLADVGLPTLAGLSVCEELLRRVAGVRVVFCSITPDDEIGLRCLACGAAGYLAKDADPVWLAGELDRAAGGECAISRHMSTRVVEELQRLSERLSERRRTRAGILTNREWQILDLLAEGQSTQRMAEELGLARETIRSHVKHVLRKLGVRSRGEAAEFARLQREAGVWGKKSTSDPESLHR